MGVCFGPIELWSVANTHLHSSSCQRLPPYRLRIFWCGEAKERMGMGHAQYTAASVGIFAQIAVNLGKLNIAKTHGVV